MMKFTSKFSRHTPSPSELSASGESEEAPLSYTIQLLQGFKDQVDKDEKGALDLPGRLVFTDALHGPPTPSTTCSPGGPLRGISTPGTCSSRRVLFSSLSSPSVSQVSHYSDIPVLPLLDILEETVSSLSSPSVSQVSHYSDIPVLPLLDLLEETGSRIMRHNIGQHKVVASTFLRIASMLPAEDKATLSFSCKLFQEHLKSYQWWSVVEAANPNVEWVQKGGATLGARLERLAKLEHGCISWDKEPQAPNVVLSNDGRTASREVSTDCHYAVAVSAEPLRAIPTKGGSYSRYCEIRMGSLFYLHRLILCRLVGSLVVGITWRSPDSIGQGRLPDARKLKECVLLKYDYSMLEDGTLGVFLAPNGDILVFNNGALLSHEKDKVPMHMASEFWLVLEVPAFAATLSEVDHLSSEIIAAAFPEEEPNDESDEAGSDGIVYASV